MIRDEEIPSKEMIKEGREFMEHLFDASVQSSVGGLGGCKHFELSWFPARFQDLIKAYIEKDLESVELCYIAMTRVKRPESRK